LIRPSEFDRNSFALISTGLVIRIPIHRHLARCRRTVHRRAIARALENVSQNGPHVASRGQVLLDGRKRL
jgi:hypothetical protein